VEKNETIKTYLDKVVTLTNDKSEVESKYRESQQDQNRFEAMQARLTQENTLLKQHNEWLNEELSSKSTVLLEDRKKASDEIVNLKTKVVEVEGLLEEKTRGFTSVQKQLDEERSKLVAKEEQCLQLKQKMSSQEALFEKEIGTAKRLISLYQDTADKGTGKIKELEGIIEELQVHMKNSAKASDEKVKEAEDKAKEAEDKAAKYKSALDGAMRAASQGVVSPRASLEAAMETPATTSSREQLRKVGDTAIQVLEMSPAAAAATMMKEGMSLTDMYGKYVEMSDAWRQERNDKKKIQGYLDTILEELERKAPLINEQKAEYERLMNSHDALAKRLEDAINERATLESTMSKARSDVQRAAREKKAIEQQAEDLSRQVQVLLKEVEDMKSGRALMGGASQTTSSANGVVGASDVITDHLVEFKSIKELQEQNKRLLAVARQLGDDNEQKVSDVRKNLEEEHTKQMQDVKSQVDKLSSQREQQEKLMQQILRQRDLYKSLLMEKESGDASGALGGSAGDLSVSVEDHKKMYLELQKDYEKYKAENAKNLQMLRDEVYKFREEAGVARGEKTQLQAQMEFERERLTRLNEICASQGKEIEGLVQKNANLIQKITQYEQRLKDISFDLDVSRDDLRRETERNVSLQAEKELLAKSENRLSEEVNTAVAEKHRQQASLESLIQRYGEQEKNWIKERERILAENQRMRESWAGAQKQLLEESSRSRDALSASTNLAADTAARIATLEVELKGATKDKDELQRELASATSNVESLQASLKKAEEKAALAVMRSTTMAQEASQNATATTGSESDVIAKLKAQLKVAQNDANEAQEAAAAAAGHLAQYKAMCTASDEALKAMKEAHHGYKQESAVAAEAAQKELDGMKTKLAEAEEEVSQKRGVDAEEEKKRLAQEEALISENSKLKEESATLKKQIELNGEKVSTLENDIKDYHQQWRTAKTMYDNELIAHAADVKRLGSIEEDLEKAKNEVKELKSARDDTHLGNAKLQSEKASLHANVEELKRQNHILHEQLESATLKTSAEGVVQFTGEKGNAEIQEVVQYLRKEKETTDCQLSLVQQENVRLRTQVEYALQKADAAEQRLEASRKESMNDKDHEKVLRDVESLNLLRESNSGLRDENMKLQAQVKDLNKRISDLDVAMLPLKEKVNQLQALLDSKDDEVKSIKDQSSRWETRTQNLLDKYGQVDLGEYQRVVKALSEAEKAQGSVEDKIKEAVKSAKEESKKELADIKVSLEKAKNQEAIAKKQIFNIFNPTRLSVPQWVQERDATKKKMEELESAQASFGEQLESFKEREKALKSEVQQAKTAKEELQLKVLEKLKNSKQSRVTLQQKVKSLEKKLQAKQDATEHKGTASNAAASSEGDGGAKPAKSPKAKKAAKKRDRESPLKPEAAAKKVKKPEVETVQAEPEVPEEAAAQVPPPAAADSAAVDTDKADAVEAEAAEAPADAGVEVEAKEEEEEEVKEEAKEEDPGPQEVKEEHEADSAMEDASLNPLAAPFTPKKLEAEEDPQAEDEGAEEEKPEEEGDAAEATEMDQADEGEEAVEGEEHTEAETEAEAEGDDDADEEPKAASTSKPKPISWKGGKKKTAVVSKEALKQAKKSATAATKAGKTARKKIVKKKVVKKKE